MAQYFIFYLHFNSYFRIIYLFIFYYLELEEDLDNLYLFLRFLILDHIFNFIIIIIILSYKIVLILNS